MWIKRWMMMGLAVVLLAGCSGNEPAFEEPSTLSGIWEGNTTASGTVYVFNLTLEQDGDGIVGSGEYITPDASVSFVVAGTYTPPGIELDFQPSERETVRFVGTVNRDLSGFSGDLRGAGLGDATIEFVREP